MEAAHDLDDHVDVVAGDQGGGVGADEAGAGGFYGRRAGLGRVGDRNADELEADAGPGGDVVLAGEEYLGQGASDVAAAEQGDPHRGRRVGVRMGSGRGGGHFSTVQAARRLTWTNGVLCTGFGVVLPPLGA
jgi:hypothetical protein